MGKTTCTALLCRVLSGAGYRVLAVDLDRCQYHLSTLLGGSPSPGLCNPGAPTTHASGVLSHLLRTTACKTLEYITLCDSLCDTSSRDVFQLRKRFEFFNFSSRYDYVLIDTPPGFGTVHELALHASDHIIVPTDLSPISLSVVKRFCAELDTRPCLSAVRCHILRHFLVPSTSAAHETSDLHRAVNGRISSHSLSAHDRIRTVTSGCPDFLELPLPRRIVSQLVLIAADLLNADRARLENAASGLCGLDYAESQKERASTAIDGLLNTPPTVILASDYSVSAS